MLWRLHIRPEPKDGKTVDDVVNYCIANNIAGIGWPLAEELCPKTPEEYETYARARYEKGCGAISFAYYPEPNDLIWAREKGSGVYYLGRLEGSWFYSNNPKHLQLDIPNQRKCRWVKIGNEENVPGKIVACFRPARTFQSIQSPEMEQFSKWIYNKEIKERIFDVQKPEINVRTFFKSISADDCEDVVGLYLQMKKGYVIIPSSCKPSTIAYEYVLKHKEDGHMAVVQVKQGNVSLDESLEKAGDKIYLFSTEGEITVHSDKFIELKAEMLFEFVQQNKRILPKRIAYWL